MKQLREHIKQRNFKHIYLFYGEEKFLIQLYLQRMLEIIFEGQDKTMNLDRFDSETKDQEKILGSLETLPFFALKRVVLLEGLDLFNNKNKAKADAIAKKMDDVKETTICFIIEDAVDKRTSLYKSIKENGFISEFLFQDEQELIQFVARELQKSNKKISTADARYFLETVGFELNTLNQEIKKLRDYLGNEEVVNKEDIDKVCTKHIEAKIFELVDAIGGKQREKAMLLYHDMLAVKEPESRILFMISRQMTLIYHAKLLSSKRVSVSLIAKQLKVPEFVAKKIIAQSLKFSQKDLAYSIKNLVDLEYGFKSGKIDLDTGIGLAIVQMSQVTPHQSS